MAECASIYSLSIIFSVPNQLGPFKKKTVCQITSVYLAASNTPSVMLGYNGRSVNEVYDALLQVQSNSDENHPKTIECYYVFNYMNTYLGAKTSVFFLCLKKS